MARGIFRGLALASLSAAFAWTGGCARTDPFRGVSLPTLDRTKTVDLASCATGRCLTVYVAPWCPACRECGPAIAKTQAFMKWRGVDMRVIVGQDGASAVEEYAKEFGPGTLLDPSGRVSARGVPHLFLSDAQGKVFRHRGGMAPSSDWLIAWALE